MCSCRCVCWLRRSRCLQPPAVQLRWLAAACGYICFFTGVPVLIFRSVVPTRDTQLRRRVAVLLVVSAALVVPDIIDYLLWQRDVLDIAFSLRHLINPFRSLANWSVIEATWLGPDSVGHRAHRDHRVAEADPPGDASGRAVRAGGSAPARPRG